ncbi:type II toxin-antitoxin system Phd/YefM family antitoxin [Mycolicibacterium chlorophenolicum]|uniref:ESX-1 secretion system protein EccCa1 n=1 Tax=Mycolicibacterium chlorophenolicum TaxID=37916 RepID=A0A0J6WLF8_9MYCO|nr:hypothetical protein [Mycolicibacterium chlorophenolicum]KMO82527.1 hypothetical protein MCHLDSM_01150 [Mycolicibacterium chlorophenolicum]
MLVDTNDLVSATEFNRNTGRYTNRAAEGRRVVIMKDQKIVAALIGVHDLNRLDALDTTSKLGFDDIPDIRDDQGADDTSAQLKAVMPIGVTVGGEPAHINPHENLLVVGRGATELMGVFVTQAGALPEAQQFVIGSDNPTFLLASGPPEAAQPAILAVSVDMSMSAQLRLAAQISGELQRRVALLRDHTVNTVEQYRQLDTGSAPLPTLTIALDTADIYLGGPLGEVVSQIVRRGIDLGVNVWLFSNAALSRQAMQLAAISQRLALHLPTVDQSRDVIGSDAAAHLKPRQAVLRNIDQTLIPVVTPTATPPLTPAAPTAPTAEQWPAMPQPGSINSIVEMWTATAPGGEPSLPLGLVDDAANHRHTLFALPLIKGGHTTVIAGPGQARAFVQILLTSAALTSPADMYFHYLGTQVPRTTPAVSSHTYEDLRRTGSKAAVQSVATALTQAAEASPRAVCLIVNIQELIGAEHLGDPFMVKEFIRDLMDDESTQHVHVVLLSNDILRLQTQLQPTRRHQAATSIYYAGIEPAGVARDVRDQIRQLPQYNEDAARHAIATHGAELANERNGVHLVLARPDGSQ